VLIEEARPIIRWETIKEHIRNERHNRSSAENSGTNPLRTLNEEQMRSLQFLYKRLTPIIRTLFIGMAALQLLWDIMLVGTMLYYHRMIEKVISGIVAILTWYFTYRFWYPTPGLLPEAPGNGSFSYQRQRLHQLQLFYFLQAQHVHLGHHKKVQNYHLEQRSRLIKTLTKITKLNSQVNVTAFVLFQLR